MAAMMPDIPKGSIVVSFPAKQKIAVTVIIPTICPNIITDAIIPPAAPFRAGGAAFIANTLFAGCVRPQPIPQITNRQTISKTEAFSGNITSPNVPRAKTAKPMPHK
jgi:hypothetical protein